MKTIEKILQLIDAEKIKPATFERKNELGNGYLKKISEGEGDITNKMLLRIRKNSKDFYDKLVSENGLDEINTAAEDETDTDAAKENDNIPTLRSLARSIELNAESRKIEARNIERLINLLEGKFSYDLPVIAHEVPQTTSTPAESPSVREDLALDKKYTKGKQV